MKLPTWLRKALVAAITVSTFGLVTPPASLLAAKEPPSDDASSPDWQHNPVGRADEAGSLTRAQFIEQTIEKAATQSHEKFGRKIAPVIEDEFRTVILPRIETVIAELAERYPEDELRYLAVSENPSGGQGERIFHLYRSDTGKICSAFTSAASIRRKTAIGFSSTITLVRTAFKPTMSLGKFTGPKIRRRTGAPKRFAVLS